MNQTKTFFSLMLRRAALAVLATVTAAATWAQTTLKVNDKDADNTTSKFFIDEAEGETVWLDVVYSPEVSNLYAVEIYSNVGRRDFWDADIDQNGVADAIRPPSGDLITSETTNSYFVAIPMQWDASAYRKSIKVDKCGAYRLTVRYKATETSDWVYHSSSTNSLGDHVVVISPKKVLSQRVYEVNGLTVKASAPTEAGRSTFADLIEGEDGFSEFGIPYLNKIQANCLWLQPIHPSDESNLAEGSEPGNPYATTDYFSVSKWYGKSGTTDGALTEFQGFVAACDAGKSPSMSKSSVGTINVMLDAAFSMSENTEEQWLSMGSYVPYWLEKTGHNFNNERIGLTDASETAYDDYGIDGLRCASAEGLPSQFWEYFINRARSKKWNFMFIAEAQGGSNPAVLCSRLFDVVDASFETAARTAGNPSELLAATETAGTACGGGAVLLNLARHDEPMPFADPWKTASSYAMLATIKGMPMTFYGQEQGIESLQQDADGISEGTIVQPNNLWTGFAKFRLTSGKWIPDFKTWNQLTIWNNPPMGADASHGMAQLYGRVNRARAASPALQSDMQWMLNQTEGYSSTDIWAMAKAEEYGALANGKDAVLAFVLFVNDIHYATSQTFSIPAGAASMLGLEAGESYTARNLASSTPEKILWTKTTEELTSEGVWVNFTADQYESAFYDDGAMVLFLKLEKCVPPATHDITVTVGANGSVTPDGTVIVEDGKDQEFTITADAGYRIESVLADGEPVAEFGIGDTNYTYTWEDVMADGTLSVTFTENVLTLLNDDSSQDADHKNSKLISDVAATGKTFNVTLQDRTLYKDGAWNTLCLPFAVEDGNTSDQLTFTGTPLEGAIVKELDATGTYTDGHQTGLDADGNLYLYFKDATSIEAGTPYIVKWTKPDGYDDNPSDFDISDPVFSGVTVSSTAPTGVTLTDGKYIVEAKNSGLNAVQFIGSYSPVTLTGGDTSNLYLGTGIDDKGTEETNDDVTCSKLYYPNTDKTLNACRAYFHVEFDEPGQEARRIVLNYGDGAESTGIVEITDPTPSPAGAGSWYSLDGRRLSGKPTTKGVYINNGRKVVIK